MSWMGGSGSFESRIKAQSKLQGSLFDKKEVAKDGQVMERDSFENRAASLFSTLPSSAPAPNSKREAVPIAPPPSWVVSGVCELPDRGPNPEEDPGEAERECESPDSALSEEDAGVGRGAAVQAEDEEDEEEDAPVVVEEKQQQQAGGGRVRPAQQRYVPPVRSSLKPSAGGRGGGSEGKGEGQRGGGAAAAEGHKKIRFSDDTSSRSRGGDTPNQAGSTEGSRAGNGKPCFSFSQTGKCKFGGKCRFTHTLPDHIANPEKYKRYEVNWDEEDSAGGGMNKAAAMATLELARKKREGEEAVDPEAERAAFERDQAERQKRMEAKKRKMAEAEGKGGAGGKKKAKGGPQLSFADEEAE